MKPQMLILMGGPGVGKGTIADMLRARHTFNYIETGEMLRNMATKNTELATILGRGDFIPDGVVCDIIATLIGNADTLLDGFPRTVHQAKWLVNKYADKFNIHVLFIDAPRDVIVARILKRRKLTPGRADDTDASVINHRIDKFNDTTMPAVNYLRTASGVQFSTIDGRGTPDENLAEAINALHQQKQ